MRAARRIAGLALLALAGCAAHERPATAAVRPAAGWTAHVVRTGEGGYRMGNPDAPVRLVMIGSRSCPMCARFDAQAATLRSEYVAGGTLSYEYRDVLIHPATDAAGTLIGICGGIGRFFPMLDEVHAARNAEFFAAPATEPDRPVDIPDIVESEPAPAPVIEAADAPASDPAAPAPAEASPAPETDTAESDYWAEMDAVSRKPIREQLSWWAEHDGYAEVARRHGLSDAEIAACLADEAALTALARASEHAFGKMRVKGSPTFFLDGRMLKEAVTWQQLEPVLKARIAAVRRK